MPSLETRTATLKGEETKAVRCAFVSINATLGGMVGAVNRVSNVFSVRSGQVAGDPLGMIAGRRSGATTVVGWEGGPHYQGYVFAPSIAKQTPPSARE
jgi:hypothetical protein